MPHGYPLAYSSQRNGPQSVVGYQLRIRLTENELIGEWRSVSPSYLHYGVYEKDHRISSQPWGGYMRSNVIHRKVWNTENELISDEYVTENHALMMYAPLLEQT